MRTGQTAVRAAVVSALAAGLSGGLLAGPAAASTDVSASPPAVSTNWYWAEKAPSLGGQGLPASLPAQADGASGVPTGDLGVGLVVNQVAPADKVAAVGFDLTTIPAGSTFSRFSVTVPVDASAPPTQTAQPDISACENIDSFLDAAGPTEISKAPPISLPSCVKGAFTAGKGYVFNLTAMANDWSFGAPSEGITLRPTTTDPGTAPFSIALLGKNKISTEAVYSEPEAVTPPVVTPAGPVLAPPPALSVGGGVAVPPAVPVVPVAPVVPVVAAPAPQTAPSVPAPQVRPVVAAGYVGGDSVPSTGWWLAVLAGLGALVLTSVVLGDPMVPVAVDARRRRFADIVRGRSQVGTPAAVRTAAPRIRPV